jgi:aminoglycoside 6'-N-acetyltransferase
MILRGERVLLRRGVAKDAEKLAQIAREPAIARWWGELDIEDFIDTDDVFVIDVDGEVVGAIQFDEEEDPMYRHAGMDIFLAPSHHGRGLGSEAIRVLARYLYNERGHHRLTIDPAAANTTAIRTYERVGFRAVGVMRRYERDPDGRWRDGLLMEMLQEEFIDTERAQQ